MDKGSWEFKYAPKSFRKDSFILPDEVRNQLLEVIRGRWKENLLLSGTAGTGKTSVCKILKENSQDFEIIDCAQYKSNSNWQAEGKGYNKVIRNTVNLTTIAEGLDNKKKIQRLVILEEFDEIVSQSLFKTILSDTTDTLFVLTTNNPDEIIEPIKNRCVQIDFGFSSYLWNENEPYGAKKQIQKDLRLLAKRILKKELRGSTAEKNAILDNPDTIKFFLNVINQEYPSIRKCLKEFRRYIVNKKLEIPERYLI